jgi:hypothetical protein
MFLTTTTRKSMVGPIDSELRREHSDDEDEFHLRSMAASSGIRGEEGDREGITGGGGLGNKRGGARVDRTAAEVAFKREEELRASL